MLVFPKFTFTCEEAFASEGIKRHSQCQCFLETFGFFNEKVVKKGRGPYADDRDIEKAEPPYVATFRMQAKEQVASGFSKLCYVAVN